jgi:hypothetical protein
MIKPTQDLKVKEPRYFQSQVFDCESEMPYPEALERGSHVACYFIENKPDYAEFVEAEKIYYVCYYSRSWPDENLVKKHIEKYDNVPFEIVSQPKKVDDNNIVQYFIYSETGELGSITEKYLNNEGNYLQEVYMDKNRKIGSMLEYEYDSDGELKYTRELLPDGRIISEYDNEFLEYT